MHHQKSRKLVLPYWADVTRILGSWVMVAAKVEEVMDITAIAISYSIPHDIHC